jgi:ribosomal protein S18 acetylase RimI-like enzyme
MLVRPVDPSEWRELRALRMRALADAPDAFGSTLEDARGYSDDHWRGLASGADGPVFVAVDAGGWAGMVRTYPDEDDATPHVAGLWVAPEARNHGVGRLLVDAFLGWARGTGADEVRLWVTETNAAAMALYRSMGFTPTERHQQLPSNPSLRESMMCLELGRELA